MWDKLGNMWLAFKEEAICFYRAYEVPILFVAGVAFVIYAAVCIIGSIERSI